MRSNHVEKRKEAKRLSLDYNWLKRKEKRERRVISNIP